MMDADGSPVPGRNARQIAILGGSSEARALADHLGSASRLWLPARDRVTGQGASAKGTLAQCVSGAAGVIIAPHPCDSRSMVFGLRVARAAGVPSVCLIRPEWRPTRRDRWIALRQVSDAAVHIPKGSRVLVTLGRPALPELAALRDVTAFVRQLTRHDLPFPLRHGRFLPDDPPFDVAHEIAVMRRYRIDAVLTRNAGGAGGWPKVAAARALGLPVYMVARPRPVVGPVLTSVQGAIRWSEAHAWLDD
jgi:precorrin-6A/cobalt-precorrin-6A reductase